MRKMKDAGKLVLFADGSIDAAASDRRRGVTTDPSMERGGGPSAVEAAPAPEQDGTSAGDAAGGGDAEVEGAVSGGGGSTTFLRARTMHEVLKVQERRLAVEVKKGALVDKRKAEAAVFRLARQERDAWLTWPSRVAAIVAAEIQQVIQAETGERIEVGAATVQRIMDRHVREHLEAMADLRIDLAG